MTSKTTVATAIGHHRAMAVIEVVLVPTGWAGARLGLYLRVDSSVRQWLPHEMRMLPVCEGTDSGVPHDAFSADMSRS